MSEWQASTTQAARLARDKLYRQIRAFFHNRHYCEVDPPLLGIAGSTDVHLHSLRAQTIDGCDYYLQTSPEFFMKRLLADGSGPIFALTKSFRCGEQGRNHNMEFTILEWYQPGFDDHQLMAQVAELLNTIFKVVTKKISYRDCFLEQVGINPHSAGVDELRQLAQQTLEASLENFNKNNLLDLIFSHQIQPNLQQATMVYDYPASQAALAKITTNNHGEEVARRFEVFYRGVELGNGYWELTDGEEQMRRFIADNTQRQRLGLPIVKADEKLVQALKAGLPDCAGIAIGVDRILMLMRGANHIDQVIDFPTPYL